MALPADRAQFFKFTAGPRPVNLLVFPTPSPCPSMLASDADAGAATATAMTDGRWRRPPKRHRPLTDVDGERSSKKRKKKRRLRLFLITSRLSRPFSAPPTYIAHCRGTAPVVVPVVLAKPRAPGHDVLRKAAIINNARLCGLAAARPAARPAAWLPPRPVELVRRGGGMAAAAAKCVVGRGRHASSSSSPAASSQTSQCLLLSSSATLPSSSTSTSTSIAADSEAGLVVPRLQPFCAGAARASPAPPLEYYRLPPPSSDYDALDREEECSLGAHDGRGEDGGGAGIYSNFDVLQLDDDDNTAGADDAEAFDDVPPPPPPLLVD
jgi:hypothetical protein